VIVLLKLPDGPGTFTVSGTATSGFPADGNPANNTASLDIVAANPAAPFTPPPAGAPRPSFRLLAVSSPGRTVQIAHAGRYVIATLAATTSNATTIRLSAERRDGAHVRPAWLAAGTSVGGVAIRRPVASVVRAAKSGARLAVHVRIAPGSTHGALQLRFVTSGRGGSVVTVVPLHVVG
jgi:hypothetical protein